MARSCSSISIGIPLWKDRTHVPLFFEGKIAVITGAGSGIGLAAAKAFAEAGASVALADVDENTVRSATVSPHGDETLRPKLVTADEIDALYDAVLLAVKAYSLDAEVADFAAAVGPETTIIPMLNGMRHIDILEERFAEAVGRRVCKVAATIDPDGRIVQLAQIQGLAYGERDGSVSPRVSGFTLSCQAQGSMPGCPVRSSTRCGRNWTLLATLGGITCLMRGNLGELVAAPGGVWFILSFLDEVVSVVSAVGEAPKPAFLEGVRKTLTMPESTQSPSMFRDLQQSSPIEADQIIGDLLARGTKAGIATPLLAAVYVQLCVYQQRHKRARTTAVNNGCRGRHEDEEMAEG